MTHPTNKEFEMIRTLTLAALAVATLGMASLVPTTADAGFKGKHFHHQHFGHKHFYGGPVYYTGGYHGCWAKRWIDTPYGPRLKKVYVCY